MSTPGLKHRSATAWEHLAIASEMRPRLPTLTCGARHRESNEIKYFRKVADGQLVSPRTSEQAR